MAGENPDASDPCLSINFNPDYDGSSGIDLNELQQLVDALDKKGGGYDGQEDREDWAVEREWEIARLERENAALRSLMGIDEESMIAAGVSLNVDQVESAHYSALLSRSRRKAADMDDDLPPSDDPPPDTSQHQQQSQQTSGGAPLPWTGESQPGMRLGTQGQSRRTGIFGGGQRGGFAGGHRGTLPGALPSPMSPGTPSSLWTNQPASPAIPLMDQQSWQDFTR